MENKVGYSRRNVFVPVPTVASFEQFNEWLWEWCEKDAQRLHYKYKVPIQELWEADREKLLQLPEYPFPVFRYEALSVNKYGFAVIDTNKYGLSPALAGKTIQAKIFFDHVEFYHDHQLAGKYRRSYGRNCWNRPRGKNGKGPCVCWMRLCGMEIQPCAMMPLSWQRRTAEQIQIAYGNVTT